MSTLDASMATYVVSPKYRSLFATLMDVQSNKSLVTLKTWRIRDPEHILYSTLLSLFQVFQRLLYAF